MALDKNRLDELRIDRTAGRTERTFPWLIAVIVLVIAGAAFGAWRLTRSKLPEVQTLVLRETSSSSGQKTLLNSSGYVVARREATVSSKITGKVVEVLVEEGMRVEKDQILARLDSSNLKASLDLAEAQMTSARSALDETKVRLHEAELDLRRVSGLATNRVASEAELDRATAEFKSLKARLERQQTEVTVAERQVALWQQQMDDTLIRAPFSAIVVSKNAQPGEMISPMSAGGFTRTGICTIVDMESLEIEIDVNESYINRVHPGQRVEATLDAYPDWKIPSKVKAIIPTADRQKATVKVRVAFEKLDPRMLPQMGVKVAFQAGAEAVGSSTVLVIPRSAVRQEDSSDVVFVLQNDRLECRAIKLGSTGGDELTVLAGLNPGDKVVVKGPSNLKDGDRVQEMRP